MRLLLVLWLLALQSCGVVGFVRYGLTQARPGNLERGSLAPDALLVGLEGEELFLDDLADWQPLVLVFGSFT